jgi:NADH:ubiquinone oxidoreductase subunit 3 (subunit A)
MGHFIEELLRFKDLGWWAIGIALFLVGLRALVKYIIERREEKDRLSSIMSEKYEQEIQDKKEDSHLGETLIDKMHNEEKQAAWRLQQIRRRKLIDQPYEESTPAIENKKERRAITYYHILVFFLILLIIAVILVFIKTFK